VRGVAAGGGHGHQPAAENRCASPTLRYRDLADLLSKSNIALVGSAIGLLLAIVAA
jgi:hypothetical protein